MPVGVSRFDLVLTQDDEHAVSGPQSLQGQDLKIGGKSYKVLMVKTDDVGDIFIIQKSGASYQYEVRHNKHPDPSKAWSRDPWSCNCPAWTRHGDPRSCKHTEAVSKVAPKAGKAPKVAPAPEIPPDNWRDSVPKDVIDYCSQSLDNEHKFSDASICTPILIDDLIKYTTMCGDGKPFTKKIIDFLKKNSAEKFVVAEVTTEEIMRRDPGYEHGSSLPEIKNMGVKWKGNEDAVSQMTQRFSEMVSDEGGSLRAEDCNYDNWDVFESE